jgi:hypothetical protein
MALQELACGLVASGYPEGAAGRAGSLTGTGHAKKDRAFWRMPGIKQSATYQSARRLAFMRKKQAKIQLSAANVRIIVGNHEVVAAQ